MPKNFNIATPSALNKKINAFDMSPQIRNILTAAHLKNLSTEHSQWSGIGVNKNGQDITIIVFEFDS